MTTTARELGDLSRRYAEAGDPRMAQLAGWAADVHVLEELLWSNGLGQAPDPAAELAAIGASVAASIEAAAATLGDTGPTGREVVEIARQALVATFDPSVHQLLTDRFDDLAHLDRGPGAGAIDADARTAARLAGLDPAELVAELRIAAADCRAMAQMLVGGDDHEAGRRLARQSEAAAFEAHLVTSAIRGGDDALVTVDLRWDLVAGEDPTPERLAAVVGSAERDTLQRTLAAAS